ncbi:ABC transporter ATP-binding protein/permease [Patescibacteria group bacterium]|nr:ABC transporter ATP-binding protein/permease [Patescibacteria group bacterium]
MKIYWQHTRKYPVAVGLTIFGVILTQACFLAAPLYMRKFFNLLASNAPTDAAAHQLFAMLAIVAGIYLLEVAGRRIEMFSNIYMQVRVMPALMETAFQHLMRHSYNFFISNFAGSLTSRVNRFGRAFEGIFDNIVISFMPTAFFVTGSVVVLFLHNKILGTALGVWAVTFVLFQLWVSKLRQPIRSARAAAETKITAVLADSISNQNTISLFSGTTHEQGIFHDVVQAWAKITSRYWTIDSLIWMCIGLFITVIEIGLLAGAVHFWRLGLMTVGDFVLIQAYLITTFDRLVAINRELRAFFSNFADAAEMVEILETPHEVADIPGAKKLKTTEGKIEFKDAYFYFKEDVPVLDNLNLTIASHQKVALVGPSGAGKSTITKLLLRFFDIKEGSIEIDGQNIADVTQDSLREAISFVPQEPVLFHRTLRENIAYGKRDATDEEVYEAAKKAHCHEFISGLKDGYDTYVGERGVKLSGGERQRVAIARAILKNSPILILDEATSSLDSESEALIQDALQTLMKGKTVIVIAHRLSTIMNMDRIVVVENGTIAAEGTHTELLEKKGLYQKLWSIQAGGFIPDDGTGVEEVEEEDAEVTE